MKSRNDLPVTFLGNLQKAWYDSEVADIREINYLLGQLQQLSGPIKHNLPLLFVIDYTARQYLVMSDAIHTISGYHPRDFLETRLDKLLEVYHKDDFVIFNQQIFAANSTFLKSVPQEEHQHYTFSYNFRFLRRDKKYARVLQRGYFITSKETGLPLYSVGMVLDITEVKTDNVMVHTIEKADLSQGIAGKQLIQANYFYPDMEETFLTRREKTVLQYLSEGLSSKQLADKLNIAENTVVNHKQNMLRKTNTKNTVELVAYSIRNHLI